MKTGFKVLALTIAVAALFASIGFLAGAEPPAVVATTNGSQLVLTPTLPVGSGAIWRVMPGAKAGCWSLMLVRAAGGQPEIFDGGLVLTFGSAPSPLPTPVPPTPTPTPTPAPDPTPPAVTAKPVAMYLIYESADLTPATARVRDGLAWKKTADSLGIKWLCFDQDQGVKKFPQATARAKAAGLPAVVFLDAQGVPDVVKIPSTAEAMETLVKTKGGAR